MQTSMEGKELLLIKPGIVVQQKVTAVELELK